MPLYTEGGTRFSHGFERPREREIVKSKGWSEAGMRRYNELHDQVLEDRAQHKKPFKKWLRAKRIELDERSRSGRKKSVVTQPNVQLKTQLYEMVGSSSNALQDDSGGTDASSGGDDIGHDDDEDSETEEEA